MTTVLQVQLLLQLMMALVPILKKISTAMALARMLTMMEFVTVNALKIRTVTVFVMMLKLKVVLTRLLVTLIHQLLKMMVHVMPHQLVSTVTVHVLT